MSTMTRSYGPHMPEHRHLLFTSVEPQSGTSEQRGGKLRSKVTPRPTKYSSADLAPVLAVSLRGSGFMAQVEPGGVVPSRT